ncbi:T9SS type A sorting domain-containing protein [Marinilabilia rubra]|uniref:CBM-cenC domain-containing protein n=1 Tax=Marinilabilia rubra TaxID=2162893 RepID=A0A2U2BB86_9BACT|nr:T9SS type A sorting domain-containing protein [Marinilabilia rubra]PWE00321.1 hypothetical protein DDZ16_05110 [Marinilabilia rubra]
MKKFLLFTAIAMAFSLGLNAQVTNGGFETFDADLIAFDGWDGYNFMQETTDVNSGVKSGRLKGGNSALSQVITVEAGETYDVSFSAKWIDSAGNIKMAFKDESNNKLGNTSVISTTTWSTINEQFVVPAGITSVKITLWKGNGTSACLLDDVSFTKATTTSINDAEQLDLLVSPNPSNGIFKLKGDKAIAAYSVYNSTGQVVKKEMGLDQMNVAVDLSTQTNGLYLVKVRFSDGDESVSKVFVK